MDREALVRAVRRRQVTELLQAERARGEALGERLEELVTELEGAALDERIFAGMDGRDAALVRAAVGADDASLYAEAEPDGGDPAEELRAYRESEVARLERELEETRARASAFEQYLELLG